MDFGTCIVLTYLVQVKTIMHYSGKYDNYLIIFIYFFNLGKLKDNHRHDEAAILLEQYADVSGRFF